MFDWVDPGVEVRCPHCGEVVTGFQSKDGPCELGTITDLSKLRQFYTGCEKCHTWIQFERRPNTSVFADFEMFAKPKGEP